MPKKFYANNALVKTLTEDVETPAELTDRQNRILIYRRQGLTQRQIAHLEKVSQPFINKELAKIKKILAKLGQSLDQDEFVGDTLTFFEDVQRRALKLYYHATKDANNVKIGDANKSLHTLMTAREKQIRLLMDMGLIKRAAIEHNHTVAPFLERWTKQSVEEKNVVVASIIEEQLQALPPPEPPEETDFVYVEEDNQEEN